MEDIMTVYKASKYCSVSPKTIINWIEAGHIKAYKTVGGHRRIKRSDLEEFMKKPDYSKEEEINKAIGHILWGDKAKPFSMRRLIFGFMEKKLGGK